MPPPPNRITGENHRPAPIGLSTCHYIDTGSGPWRASLGGILGHLLDFAILPAQQYTVDRLFYRWAFHPRRETSCQAQQELLSNLVYDHQAAFLSD